MESVGPDGRRDRGEVMTYLLLLRFDSPWQIRSVAIEEARLMLACFVEVRDRGQETHARR